MFITWFRRLPRPAARPESVRVARRSCRRRSSTSERRPPGCSSRVARRSGSGSRRASTAAAAAAAATGSSGPPSAVARKRAMAARYSRSSYSQEWRPSATTWVSVIDDGSGGPAGHREAAEIGERHHAVVGPVAEHDRRGDVPDRPRRADRRDRVAPRAEVDAGGDPGERPRDQPGERQPREPEGLASEAGRVGRRGDGDDSVEISVVGRGDQCTGGSHRVTQERHLTHLGSGSQPRAGCPRVGGILAHRERESLGPVAAVPADVDRQDVESGRVEDLGMREGAVTRRFPAVDQRDSRCPRRDRRE